jgi:hypothetical protein
MQASHVTREACMQRTCLRVSARCRVGSRFMPAAWLHVSKLRVRRFRIRMPATLAVASMKFLLAVQCSSFSPNGYLDQAAVMEERCLLSSDVKSRQDTPGLLQADDDRSHEHEILWWRRLEARKLHCTSAAIMTTSCTSAQHRCTLRYITMHVYPSAISARTGKLQPYLWRFSAF